MAILQHHKRLGSMVKDGMVRQAIVVAINRIHPGTPLTHMQGKAVLCKAVCRNVVEIDMYPNRVLLRHPIKKWESVLEGPNTLTAFAHKHGFCDWREIINFYQAEAGFPTSMGAPLSGWVVVW